MSELQHPAVHPIMLPTPFPVGPVNVYVVRGDALVLFDTGPKTDEVYDQLVAALRGLGLTPGDLDAIVVTHGHIDHIGLLNRLIEDSGAASYGHPFVMAQWTYSEEKAAQRRAYFSDLFASYGVPEPEADACIEHWNSFRLFTDDVELDRPIDQGDTLFGFEVHHLPGHSPSDLVFTDTQRGFTITGDHLLPDMSPNPLMRKPLHGKSKVKSLVEYRHSLRRCRELDMELCFPGHGSPFRNHRAVIDTLLGRHDRRSAQVQGLLAEAPRSPYSVSQALFPRLPAHYLYLGLSAAIGHLEVLEDEGRASPRWLDNRLMYHINR